METEQIFNYFAFLIFKNAYNEQKKINRELFSPIYKLLNNLENHE